MDLTSEQIENYRRRAQIVAKIRGFPELADDFSQEIFLEFPKHRGATLDQLFIDYVRRLFGDPRTKGGRGKSRCYRRYKEVTDFEAKLEDPRKPSYLSLPKSLSREERIVLVLTYVWGFELEELAQAFGMTRQRCWQFLRDARKKIKEATR